MDVEHERALLRRRVLGWGLACEPVFPGADLGRDLRLERGPNGLDFARLEGTDNLNQALTMALTTPLGDDVFNIAYGFDGLNALAEETNPILARERIRVAIIQVLRKDPRVRQIVDVKVAGGQLEPPVPGDRSLAVRVDFIAVTTDRSSLEFGKGLNNGG
jgi:phage baseplate assembly protein W